MSDTPIENTDSILGSEWLRGRMSRRTYLTLLAAAAAGSGSVTTVSASTATVQSDPQSVHGYGDGGYGQMPYGGGDDGGGSNWWDPYTDEDEIASSAGQHVLPAIDDFENTGSPDAGKILTLIESFETLTPVPDLINN